MALLGAALLLTGCSEKLIDHPSGMKYRIVKQGSGASPKPGDLVKVHYVGTLASDGSEFDSSRKRGRPFRFPLGKGRVIRGWDIGVALMKKGERRILVLPANLAYGQRGAGAKIPPGATLRFDVELLDFSTPQEVKVWPRGSRAVKRTSSGLSYVVFAEGSGAKPTRGQNVSVHYTGYLKGGKIFDSSHRRGDPIQFPLGAGRVIPGWDEGIALMSPGARFKLIIPARLAYGARGRPPVIPANATLYFDVELVKIGN